MTRTAPLPLALLACLVSLLGGCAEGPVKADPAVVAELRARFVLADEPDDAQTALDWRDQQEAAEAEDAPEAETTLVSSDDQIVTLVGAVGGMPNPWGDAEPIFPWRKGEAVFFLVDPATADEFAAHEAETEGSHENCPFCAREAANKANAIAAVRFLAANGQPAKVEARELFNLKEGDHVVVRGRASLLGGDLLVIDANGLYLRE